MDRKVDPNSVIQIDNLQAGPQGFLKNITLTLNKGEFTCIIGPNGSGKTTLLKALSSLIPSQGLIQINGIPLHEIPRKQFAQQVAVVPNVSVPEFDFSVVDIIETGRVPHHGFFSRINKRDRECVENAAIQTDVAHLLERKITTLSTGEYQRVLLARALTQETPILFLDEPTAHLDLGHQIRVFTLLSDLKVAKKHTILCVSHDLNMAAEFADRLILMSQGRIYADGTPAEVVTVENIKAVYNAAVNVELRGARQRPHIFPRNQNV